MQLNEAQNSKLLSKHYLDLESLLCLEGEVKAGRKYFFKAVSVHPFNAKLLLWTAASIFGPTTYNRHAEF
jgi:hypothetical protein